MSAKLVINGKVLHVSLVLHQVFVKLVILVMHLYLVIVLYVLLPVKLVQEHLPLVVLAFQEIF